MTAVVIANLLPESLLETKWFAVLAAFVAINTAMYVILAIITALPRVYPKDYLPRTYQRGETRSIYPDVHEPNRRRNAELAGARNQRVYTQAEWEC